MLVSSWKKYQGTSVLRKPSATILSLCPQNLLPWATWISHRGLIFAAFSAYLSGKRAWNLERFWFLLYNNCFNTLYRPPKRCAMHNTLTQFASLKCNTFYRSVLREVISFGAKQDELSKLRHQHFVPRPSREHWGPVACVSTEIPQHVLDQMVAW